MNKFGRSVEDLLEKDREYASKDGHLEFRIALKRQIWDEIQDLNKEHKCKINVIQFESCFFHLKLCQSSYHLLQFL